jgi:hypothetical protein
MRVQLLHVLHAHGADVDVDDGATMVAFFDEVGGQVGSAHAELEDGGVGGASSRRGGVEERDQGCIVLVPLEERRVVGVPLVPIGRAVVLLGFFLGGRRRVGGG